MNLNDLQFFVQAVDCGGFAAAARRLGVPKSTISKRVAELEARLGARLIHRTSRSFSLTDLGRDFFQHARASVIEAENAENIVRTRLGEPSGTVRLTTSVPTAQFTLAPHLLELSVRYPKLTLAVHVTDRFVDIVQEGFDIAIRSHQQPLADSALVQRRLGIHDFYVVASPGYVAQHGAPSSPEELAQHKSIVANPSETSWRLSSTTGGNVEAGVNPIMAADEPFVLLKAAAAGIGITCLPTSVCRGALADGTLVRLLPDWTAGSITTTILMPHRRGQLPSVRAVVDLLLERAGNQRPEISPSLSD
ncbi:MAG: Bacterial regulatory helix-turn-helix, lysR family protein [Rhizobium sp.]|nr:Bacterial regulatory helix-turn-helix, lysR family protein [Rhizobium sp.]